MTSSMALLLTVTAFVPAPAGVTLLPFIRRPVERAGVDDGAAGVGVRIRQGQCARGAGAILALTAGRPPNPRWARRSSVQALGFE